MPWLSFSVLSSSSKIYSRILPGGSVSRFFATKPIHPKVNENVQELTGLYGYGELKSASGFERMASEAIRRSQELVREVTLMPPSPRIIGLLDETSDILCKVLDAAELCRNTHPKQEYAEAADRAFASLSQYVQGLNASPPLYSALRRCLAECSHELCAESRRVCDFLLKDMERGGVHLPSDKRQEIDNMGTRISILSNKFRENIAHDESSVDVFPASSLRYLPTSIGRLLPVVHRDPHGQVSVSGSELTELSGSHGYRVPLSEMFVSSVLKWVPEERVRRQVHSAACKSPEANAAVLKDLVQERHRLAMALGFPNFAEYQTSFQMAGSAANVVNFLEAMSGSIRVAADEEVQILEGYKRRHSGNEPGGLPGLQEWDTPFFTGLAKARRHQLDAGVISQYFPLPRLLAGLGKITESLFGLSLLQLPMAAGESWHPDVLKFELSDPHKGCVGHIYFDFFQRARKFPSAAHFTLRCGRALPGTASYQLAVVCLVFNIPRGGSSACLLTHAEVETIFHEFGHALHSTLSATKFQHLSGTRCELDFVEIPSILFEHFAWDERVLQQFSAHYLTGEPIPSQLVRRMNESRQMFAAWDLQNQLIFALSDQALFGHSWSEGGDPAEILMDVRARHSSIPCALQRECHWERRFSHFVGYAAGYYSYSFAKCFAAELWTKYFADDPLNAEAGKQLRDDLLQFGGAKEPSVILGNLLERPQGHGPGHGIEPDPKYLWNEINRA